MPCAATRVGAMMSCGPVGILEARARRRRARRWCRGRAGARAREALEHRLLDLDVAGEDDQRLAGGQEVVDPGQRGVQLAAGGEALERAELGQALGAQRRRDLGVELGEVERLLAQPGDRRRCSARRYSRSLSSATGHHDLALGRQLGQDLGLQPPHEAAPAQVPVQALLRQRAAELAREARARAEVLQAAEHAQLADELLGVVEHRRAGQRQAQAVGRHSGGQAAHRLGALGLRVLDAGATRRRPARAGAGAPAPRGGRRRSRS